MTSPLMTSARPRPLLPELLTQVLEAAQPRRLGVVAELLGLHVLVRGVDAAVGDVVEIQDPALPRPVYAEVAASGPAGLVCLPMAATTGLRVGMHVRSTGGPLQIPVGPELLGRVLDGLGRPIDGGPPLSGLPQVSVEKTAPPALSRARITQQVGLEVRALDTLVPCGRGQRVAFMAGSGVG